MRILKAATAAALALSMSATPVLAQSAAPLSLVASAGMMQDDDGDGMSNEGNQVIPALIIAGLLAAAILITTNKDNDIDNPRSP